MPVTPAQHLAFTKHFYDKAPLIAAAKPTIDAVGARIRSVKCSGVGVNTIERRHTTPAKGSLMTVSQGLNARG